MELFRITFLKLMLILLTLAQSTYAKRMEKKDIRLDATKITGGTIEVEKVEHFENISAAKITLKLSRTIAEKTTKYYSCTIRDTAGNSLQKIESLSLPEETGIKERRQIPISYLPEDLKLPIIITFKTKYICTGGECKEVSN